MVRCSLLLRSTVFRLLPPPLSIPPSNVYASERLDMSFFFAESLCSLFPSLFFLVFLCTCSNCVLRFFLNRFPFPFAFVFVFALLLFRPSSSSRAFAAYARIRVYNGSDAKRLRAAFFPLFSFRPYSSVPVMYLLLCFSFFVFPRYTFISFRVC